MLFYRLYGKYDSCHPFWCNFTQNERQNFRYERMLSPTGQELYDLLNKRYLIDKEGLKVIAKELNTSYMLMRQVMNLYQIPLRKGQSVVTDALRKRRSDKAISEWKTHSGWFNPDIRRKIKKYNARGVQGYFYNSTTNNDVWLRSTYEFIFAKWLNRTKQNWKIEVTHYVMPDGRIYRPDFFLYDDNWNLLKIVEIKGYWDNNSDKAIILSEITDVEVCIIKGKSICKFIEERSTYEKELQKWKEVRRVQS